MLPLPAPSKSKETKDGIKALKAFINVKDDADFSLIIAWVVGAFRGHGPYAVLAFIAQHGSAKSTSLKILLALIDSPATTTCNRRRNRRAWAVWAVWAVVSLVLRGTPQGIKKRAPKARP
jgi:hypothetical protein